MTTTKNTKSPTRWSIVIDVILERDPTEGVYSVSIINADGSTAERHDLLGVTERAAMIEATALVRAAGWEPTSRTWDDDRRRFRRAP